jgi:hypothetical protein
MTVQGHLLPDGVHMANWELTHIGQTVIYNNDEAASYVREQTKHDDRIAESHLGVGVVRFYALK